MAGLPRVTRIALIDSDREQKPRAADLVRPGGDHARDAGLLDVFAQQRGADDRAVAADFVRRPLRRAAEQDRIVAVVDGLDVEHGFGPQVAGVITGPLAERAFDARLVRLD